MLKRKEQSKLNSFHQIFGTSSYQDLKDHIRENGNN